MHLRRALLLFAIVLGLVAIATSISRPRDRSSDAEPLPPATAPDERATAAPGPAPGTVEVTFIASDPDRQGIDAGQAATVYVEVMEPGQVDIAELGTSSAAEPETPARFDVFTRQTGRYPITFEPASDEERQERVGTLVVR